ncbi:hypothetical protein [Streptomyces yaizuensis]|uniref:Membrane protein n=1 Tax=Streptomyces yaizuensis TaxID=2989713 RepID=A0ABQ5PB16_9ACTN|nr:hypothetical protein [Streptomyces sp. YSPA8]GLF99765.1 membrane protein [Streptomyces sp. YSPA8]
MSSDQQYPYGGQYDGQYGGPYDGQPSYGEHGEHGEQAPAPGPYDPYQQQAYPPQQPYPPQHQQQQHQAYQQQFPYEGQRPQGPYAGQAPAYPAGPGAGSGYQDPGYRDPGYAPAAYQDAGAAAPQDGAAQTWEGETWDTSYQPVIPADLPAAPHGAEETAYLPPVRGQAPPPPAGAGYGPPSVHGATAPRPAAPAAPVAPAPPAAPAVHGPTGSVPLPPEAPAPRRHAAAAAPAPAPAPASPDGGPEGWNAPTTSGSVRLTAAQRARAEGRSPIIPPGIEPAAATAGLALLLAGGAAVHTYALLLPLVLLQAVTAAGWFRLNGMWPARQGIALAFAGGLVADAALLAAGRENAPGAVLGTLGVWVLITLVLQLRSRAGADERMYGLMATVVSAALAVLGAVYLAAPDDAVVAGAFAVAGAAVVRALPLPGPVSVAAALLAGTAAALVSAGPLSLSASDGAVLGLASAVLALVGLRVASYDYPSRFVHFTAGVALPLTAAAPAVYVLGRVLT